MNEGEREGTLKDGKTEEGTHSLDRKRGTTASEMRYEREEEKNKLRMGDEVQVGHESPSHSLLEARAVKRKQN